MQFCSAQSRYHTNQSSSSSAANNHLGSSQPRRYHQYQQHQISSGGRKIPDKFTTGGLIVRNNKFKVNGLNQKSLDDNIGGAGDAQGARIQMTPPTTPRNVQEANSMSDACHKIQALTL
uniref:Uncharacterized protein n=1 Tax=Bracon brevicornis TaxID=1563983 RepID=A0A6V7K9R5_9HYME